jgi:hypothetical protein
MKIYLDSQIIRKKKDYKIRVNYKGESVARIYIYPKENKISIRRFISSDTNFEKETK